MSTGKPSMDKVSLLPVMRDCTGSKVRGSFSKLKLTRVLWDKTGTSEQKEITVDSSNPANWVGQVWCLLI